MSVNLYAKGNKENRNRIFINKQLKKSEISIKVLLVKQIRLKRKMSDEKLKLIIKLNADDEFFFLVLKKTYKITVRTVASRISRCTNIPFSAWV